MILKPFLDKIPQVHNQTFVAENATLIGEVVIGCGSSVWYGSVLRGDVGSITIGKCSNIQDLSVIHASSGKSRVWVGDYVTVGHRAILHGCNLHDYVLVGMGSIVMDNVEVGEGAIIAAGAVVLENTIIPPYTLWAGVPARQVKTLDSIKTKQNAILSAEHYSQYH